MARSLRKRGRGLPADDAAAVDVDHEGDVDPAGERLDIGQVGHPQAVGTIGHELAVHQVGRSVLGLVGDGGPLEGLASSGAAQVQVSS